MNPQRIQRRRTKGWRAPAGVVNCTRPSDWSNPFHVGDKLLNIPPSDSERENGVLPIVITGPLAVHMFAELVHQRGWWTQMREELRGKDLMCWCRLRTQAEDIAQVPHHCHVDWILGQVNR